MGVQQALERVGALEGAECRLERVVGAADLALDEGVGRLLLLEALEDRRLVTQAGDGLARLAVDQENGRPLLAIRTSRVLELPFGSRCILCAVVSREALGQWRPQPRRSTDTRPMKAVFSFDFATPFATPRMERYRTSIVTP